MKRKKEKRVSHMSVGKKLNLAFITLIVLLATSIGSTFLSLTNINSQVEEVLEQRMDKLLLAADIRRDVAAEGTYLRSVVLNPNDTAHRSKLLSTMSSLEENLATLEPKIDSDEFQSYYDELIIVNQALKKQIDIVLNSLDTNDRENALITVNARIGTVTDQLLATAQKMMDFQTDYMEEIQRETRNSITFAILISAIVFIISLAAASYLMMSVRKTITKPLKEVIGLAKSFGEGDLTTEDIEVRSKDEIGQLATVFNESKHTFRNLISRIQGSSEQLSASSQELSASAEEVLATTEEVARQADDTAGVAQGSASAANESAIAMDETAQGVQRIAEASQVLFDSSNQTNKEAQSGTGVINQATQQMNTIFESSSSVNTLIQKLASETEEIENIIDVLTSITAQTNLLALNATIEAARAGEQGKGFLVVAEEVRKLAEESKKSATSINALTLEIKEDTQKVAEAMSMTLPAVEEGVSIIGQAGTSFNSIVSAVREMTNQIQDISTTAEELSASAEQVSASVSEISNGSQLTSNNIDSIAVAMREQSDTISDVANVAMSLSQTSQVLQEESRKFKA
jgi:methyl-accepting chemotaxis protein